MDSVVVCGLGGGAHTWTLAMPLMGGGKKCRTRGHYRAAILVLVGGQGRGGRAVVTGI